MVMMKCGHVANAIDKATGKPCCAICNSSEAFIPQDERILLDERFARCPYCHRTVKSDESLPFFKHRPKRDYDEFYDGCRGWG